MDKDVRKTTKTPEFRRRAGLAVQLLGAVLAVSAVAVTVLSSHAGATTLSNSIVTLRLASSGDVADNPLSDGEVVDVAVAANSELKRSSLEAAGYPSGAVPIKMLECADSGGEASNLPTEPTECDPTTVAATAILQSDGSLLLKGFTIYALPDLAVLGPSNGTVCDASHECVVGIFSDQNDFTKPHIFSAPFEVASSPASDSDTAGSAANTPGTGANSNATSSSGSAGASVALANTGSPTLWPWLVGLGAAMFIGGTVMRLNRRGT
jgi:hypothetical protein